MPDFGEKLRAARERRGVSLREIAEHTKLSTSALESLERNDASRLPGGIFARAFVRAYASEVGLDPEATVREFVERFNIDPPLSSEVLESAESGRARGSSRPHRTGAMILKIVAVSLAAMAIIFYLTRARHSEDSSTGPASDARRTSRRVVSTVPKGSQLP